MLGCNVDKINEKDNSIILDNNQELKYDKLILANGSSNFIPPIEGVHLEGVYTLRNKKDLDNIFLEAKLSEQLILICDEVHRLNKDKQDVLLPQIRSAGPGAERGCR